MKQCVCERIGPEPKTSRRVRGLGLELAQPPSSPVPAGNADFYPEGSGLKNALFRKVAGAWAAVEERGEILLTPGKDLAPYLKAVRRWMCLRRGLEAVVMGEREVVWELAQGLVPLQVGELSPDDCGLVISDFFTEGRVA